MYEPETHLPPSDEADLVALADGNLTAARRMEVEARVGADPALAEALNDQRAALALLATAGAVPMPPALRARVCELQRAGARKRVRLRRWRPALGAALAVTGAALVLLTWSAGPRVDDVLDAAVRPATAQAAPHEAIDGLTFPAYENWRATGVRTDEFGGRATRTVFYERGDKTIAYTIVARPALAGGEHRRLVTVHGRPAVQWTLDGHTCLVSGDVAPAVLFDLAAHSRS